MPTTYTATTMSREPVVDHTGAITVYTQIGSAAATYSVADIIHFLKIPDRAKLIEGYCSRAVANGDLTVSLGGTLLITAGSAATNSLAHGARGRVVSITASNPVKYQVVKGAIGSATITGTLKLSITYTMDHESNT